MQLTRKEIDFLINEISRELGAKRDGSGKNLIARCPHCGKEGKFGVYIGRETERKKMFMSHCFRCGNSTYTLEQLLMLIDRPDLSVTKTVDLDAPLPVNMLFPLEAEEEIDDSLVEVELPDFYKRSFSHPYLKSRGFIYDDYDYFPVGTTGKLNFRFTDYVIFPILEEGIPVGYVGRHVWSKSEIDAYNRTAKLKGEFILPRFRNSTENDFVKLLYNYDAIVEGETDIVVLVEGVFDVIALTRKLELYDCTRVAVVATFGKKISNIQIYKLQAKGIETVVIGYDGDAVAPIKKIAENLSSYFEVFIADITDPNADWDTLSYEDIYRVFSYGLKTPREYNITKIQEL